MARYPADERMFLTSTGYSLRHAYYFEVDERGGWDVIYPCRGKRGVYYPAKPYFVPNGDPKPLSHIVFRPEAPGAEPCPRCLRIWDKAHHEENPCSE